MCAQNALWRRLDAIEILQIVLYLLTCPTHNRLSQGGQFLKHVLGKVACPTAQALFLNCLLWDSKYIPTYQLSCLPILI